MMQMATREVSLAPLPAMSTPVDFVLRVVPVVAVGNVDLFFSGTTS